MANLKISSFIFLYFVLYLALTFQPNNHKPLKPFDSFLADSTNHHKHSKHQKQIDNFLAHNDDKKPQYNLLNYLLNPNFPANYLLYYQHKDEYNQNHNFVYLAATVGMLLDTFHLLRKLTDYKYLRS